MAKKRRTKEDYPIVKYRIVDGNGYSLCESEQELLNKLEMAIAFADKVKEDRFKPQYVVKVTEEYIDLKDIKL